MVAAAAAAAVPDALADVGEGEDMDVVPPFPPAGPGQLSRSMSSVLPMTKMSRSMSCDNFAAPPRHGRRASVLSGDMSAQLAAQTSAEQCGRKRAVSAVREETMTDGDATPRVEDGAHGAPDPHKRRKSFSGDATMDNALDNV